MKNNDGGSSMIFMTALQERVEHTLFAILIVAIISGVAFLCTTSIYYAGLTALISIGIPIVFRKFGFSTYWVIRLDDQGIHLGRILPCFIDYQDVNRLVIGSLWGKYLGGGHDPFLTIQTGMRSIKIRLNKWDAKDCLNFICKLSPYAGGVDYSNIEPGYDMGNTIDRMETIEPQIQSKKFNRLRSRPAWTILFVGIVLALPTVYVLTVAPWNFDTLTTNLAAMIGFGAGMTMIGKGFVMLNKVKGRAKEIIN